MKKSFVLYLDQYEIIKKLNEEQKSKLLDYLFLYNLGIDIKIDDPFIDIVFTVFKQTFDRDTEKWNKKAEKNRENGKKGGRPKINKNDNLEETHNNPKNPDGLEETHNNPDEPKKAVSGTVIVNENDIKDIPDSDESGESVFYLTKKKRKLTGKRLETFNQFWEVFNFKKSKADAADSWLDIPMLTDKLVNEILVAAELEANNRQSLIDKGSTPKWPQGWITSRRWEDEINTSQKTTDTGCDLPTL